MRVSIIKDTGCDNPTLTADAEGEIVKAFIEAELQADPAYAALLHQRLADPKNSPFEISGNLFNLTLSKTRFEIENLFDEAENVKGERSFLADLIEQWMTALGNK